VRARAGAVALAILLVAAVTGCAQPDLGDHRMLWHQGEITIGTGPTNGVFNQVGGGYADVINRHMPGYEAVAVPTNGSAENLQRLDRGEIDVALTFGDVAADAVGGTGPFAGKPLQIRALARVFNSYTHLVVRNDAHISTVEDLKGKRVGTGPVGSGSEEVALRVLAAAKLDPDRDVQRTAASLALMAASMQAGTLDAMFYSAGLPTVGVTALLQQMPGKLTVLPVNSVLPALDQAYPRVYSAAVISKATYGLAADVPTIAVPNLIVVSESMPDDIAADLTRMIFEFQPELAAVHAEGKNITRDMGPQTDPVRLHSGARVYYGMQ
jgi:TRAP transporter TAXI family solute receptor